MEFLNEQGVQPCGHKAREKGMVIKMFIKMFASCKSNEIPTEYRYSVSGTRNVEKTGVMYHKTSKSLLKTQTTDAINSSSRVYFRILPQRGQTPTSKILGGGGKYKAKEGQPHIKRTEKPIPRGGKRIPRGGAKAPPGPP